LHPSQAQHPGERSVAWCVNAIVITKQASGTAKIDPLMAAFKAIALKAATRLQLNQAYSG